MFSVEKYENINPIIKDTSIKGSHTICLNRKIRNVSRENTGRFSTNSIIFNPYHAEFLKWNNPSSIFGTTHYHFLGKSK